MREKEIDMEKRISFRHLLHLLHPLLLLLLLLLLSLSVNYVNIITPSLGEAISKVDSCPINSSSSSSSSSLTPCQAMVTYFPYTNMKLSDIAFYFSIQDYTSLLGPNQLDLSIPDLPNVVLPAAYPIKIPIHSCACSPLLPNSTTRVATSINYTVVDYDTLSGISNAIYSGLVTYRDIGDVSGITNYNLIFPDQSLSIPIPCACPANGSSAHPDDGRPAEIVLSYQVQKGDNLSAIATAYNSSVPDLRSFNGNITNHNLNVADILFVPLSVCKANFSSNAEDKNLQVLEGAYELTANGCVQCNCQNGTLHCFPSNFSLVSDCGNQTCFNSTLMLGDFVTSPDANGCLVTSCIYMGYNSFDILSRLESQVEDQCPTPPPPETMYNPPNGLLLSPPPPSSPSPPLPTNPNSFPNSASLALGSNFSLYNFIVFELCFWLLSLL